MRSLSSFRSLLRTISALSLCAQILFPFSTAQAVPTRLKELVEVQGMRTNAIFGYGLVVGLSGTGDSERTFFTAQSVSGMLGRLGVRVNPQEIRARNVAAVMVTASLPTFARPGSRLDITVSSLGNARSIVGGMLLVTPLQAANGAVYALAQGPVQVGGFDATSMGSLQRKNTVSSGRVPEGATVEKSVLVDLAAAPLMLTLKRPDFTTANRVASALGALVGETNVRALDAAAIEVKFPEAFAGNAVGLLAKLEEVEVEADQRAKLVISERTGTLVAGERVRIRPVAVAHGGLEVTIAQSPVFSQPGAYSYGGRTRQSAISEIRAEEAGHNVVALPATATVNELVKALNTLGVSPRDLISIIQALKVAGALDADVEVI